MISVFFPQAFLSPIDCTERRNLVYNFKSLLKRDAHGNVIAGVYFALKPFSKGQFSLFYQDGYGQQVDFKMSFADALNQRYQLAELSDVDDGALLESLRKCQAQLELSSDGGLARLLFHTAKALNDQEFMQQLLDINQRIVLLSENN